MAHTDLNAQRPAHVEQHRPNRTWIMEGCQDLICILPLWTSSSLLQYTPYTSPLHTYVIYAYTQLSKQYIETPWCEGAPPSQKRYKHWKEFWQIKYSYKPNRELKGLIIKKDSIKCN